MVREGLDFEGFVMCTSATATKQPIKARTAMGPIHCESFCPSAVRSAQAAASGCGGLLLGGVSRASWVGLPGVAASALRWAEGVGSASGLPGVAASAPGWAEGVGSASGWPGVAVSASGLPGVAASAPGWAEGVGSASGLPGVAASAPGWAEGALWCVCSASPWSSACASGASITNPSAISKTAINANNPPALNTSASGVRNKIPTAKRAVVADASAHPARIRRRRSVPSKAPSVSQRAIWAQISNAIKADTPTIIHPNTPTLGVSRPAARVAKNRAAIAVQTGLQRSPGRRSLIPPQPPVAPPARECEALATRARGRSPRTQAAIPRGVRRVLFRFFDPALKPCASVSQKQGMLAGQHASRASAMSHTRHLNRRL